MSKDDLDTILKNISLKYIELYNTNNLKIEIDVRKMPESVKLKVSDFRSI